MNLATHAIRVGRERGWTEFKNSLKAPQDLGFYVVVTGIALAYLIANRDSEVEGTSLLLPTVLIPSILGGLLAFGMIIGPAYQIAIEREDGTLLRAKAIPHGMAGYVTGQVVLHSLSALPSLGLILVPSLFLFDDVMSHGLSGWLMVVGILIVGTLATLPIGMVLGSLVKNSRQVGTWGMAPVMGLVAISGIFAPMESLWGWVQGLAQVFPMYWLGHGMRAAFLPDSAASYEIGGSWRLAETFGVLGLWAMAGLLLAPILLRRMARRESGSAVEARKQEAMQRTG